jgi:alanine racemase
MDRRADITRPLEARVDLGNIKHNVAYLKGLLPAECLFMAVVKANAYGHGDVEVSKAALSVGADSLGVALVEEAERLRGAGLSCPVYLLFEPPPEAAGSVLDNNIICAVYTHELAKALSGEAEKRGVTARVQLKVDTGMRRVGVHPGDVAGFARLLAGLPGLSVEGIYTHFAVATEPDDTFTEKQMDLFESAASEAEQLLGRPLLKHAANSAGVLAFPRSHYDMVRVGIAMYGLPPSERFGDVTGLIPALSLVGEISLVKKVGAGEGISYGLTYAPSAEAYIATIPIGYADGFSRILSGRAEVLIDGTRRPVVGTICMDLSMVELGVKPVPPGTRFVVIGNDGDDEITAGEVAGKLGTINYEVVCMISARVPRIYTEGGAE